MKEKDALMLASTILRIAHGDENGACGLEALAMAINGDSGVGKNNLADAVSSVANAINRVAEAIEDRNVIESDKKNGS